MENIDPIVYSVKWVQSNQKKMFILPNLVCICLIIVTCYRTIKISCESALLKSSGMKWKNINSILWSVEYLPFLLRLSITQNWPLLNPWPIYVSPAFFIGTKLEFALGKSFCHNFGLYLFCLLRCQSLAPEVPVPTFAFRNTCATKSASAASPPFIFRKEVHATSSWLCEAVSDRILWPPLNSVICWSSLCTTSQLRLHSNT